MQRYGAKTCTPVSAFPAELKDGKVSTYPEWDLTFRTYAFVAPIPPAIVLFAPALSMLGFAGRANSSSPRAVDPHQRVGGSDQ